jgi:hypothetical protein
VASKVTESARAPGRKAHAMKVATKSTFSSDLQSRTSLSTADHTHRLPAVTPYPAILTESGLGDLGVPRAEPVNVEIEDGGETRASVQRRDRDSASPILYVVFTHA